MKHEKHLTYDNALERCASLCARAECCASELLKKMKGWNVDAADADKVINWLYDHNFINDERFARAYSRDKICFNRWGRRKVAMMLRRMGLDNDVIETGLAAVDEQDYREMAISLVQRRAREVDLAVYENKMKAVRWMVSRGFEQQLVFDLLEQCIYPH